MITNNNSAVKVYMCEGWSGLIVQYGIIAFFTFVIASKFVETSGWVRYVKLGVVEIVVLLLAAIIDHRRKNTYPAFVRIDHTTVTLKRFWNYKSFDLSDVMMVDDPIVPSPLNDFCRPISTVVFLYGGENCKMYFRPNFGGYRELLRLLSGKSLPVPVSMQDVYGKSYSFENKSVWWLRVKWLVVLLWSYVIIHYSLVESNKPFLVAVGWLLLVWIYCNIIKSSLFDPVKIKILPNAIVCQMLYGWYITVPRSDIVSVKDTSDGELKLTRLMKPSIGIAPYFKDFDSLAACLLELVESPTSHP